MLTPPFAQALDAIALFLILAGAFSGIAALFPVRHADASRHERTTRYRLFLPPIGAFVIVALGFVSALFDAWDRLPDHCGYRHVHEATLCYLHPVGIAGLFPDEIATLLVAVPLLGLMAYRAVRLVVDAYQLSKLRGDASVAANLPIQWPGPVVVLRDDRPICFTFGLFTHRLVLTTGVLASLERDDLLAVIAHERAHVDRNDGVWRVMASFAAILQLPGLGRRALSTWAAAGEALCDEAAARQLGSRLAVAGTLVRFQRLLNLHGNNRPVGALAFAGDGVLETRVRRLLKPAVTNTDLYIRHWPWLVLAACCWQIGAIHVALEHLLRLIHA